jgi:hypothetical protein
MDFLKINKSIYRKDPIERYHSWVENQQTNDSSTASTSTNRSELFDEFKCSEKNTLHGEFKKISIRQHISTCLFFFGCILIISSTIVGLFSKLAAIIFVITGMLVFAADRINTNLVSYESEKLKNYSFDLMYQDQQI